MTFGGHIVARVASFAPELTNKLYARQKSFDYHYYQHTRPNRTNSFHKKKSFNRDVA